MKISVESGDIAARGDGCLVVNLFEGITPPGGVPGGGTGAVDIALGGMITELIRAGDIRGKSGEMTLLHTFGKIAAARVLVAGLGKSGDFTVDKVRDLSANVARFLRGKRIGEYATIAHGAGIAGWTRRRARRRSPRARCWACTASTTTRSRTTTHSRCRR